MPSRGLPAFLCTVFQRVQWVSLLVSLALLVLYGVGNVQGFLDATQYLLLDFAGATLWVAFIAGPLVIVLLLLRTIHERRFPFLRFVLTLISTAASGALVALLSFLTAWMTR